MSAALQDLAPFQRELPVVKFKASDKTIPVPPENKTVKRAEELFQEARAYRDQDLKMMDRWRSNRAWYLSTGRDRGALGSTTTYVNLIFEKCQKLAADVTEAMPQFNFRAPSPDQVRLSEILNRAIPGVWESNDGDRKYRGTALANIVYGTWIWKVDHDPGYGGRGPKVRIRAVPAYRFFPAPHATSMASAPYVIEVRPVTVETIKNTYGVEVSPELESDFDFPDISEDLDVVKDRGISMGSEASIWGSNTGVIRDMFPMSSVLFDPKPKGIVFQKEMHIYDAERLDRYWIDKSRGMPELAFGQDLKFPKGRVISWANGKLLYDRPAPYERPYAKFVDNPFPEFFWGLGEVPQLINLQLLHDDTLDNIRLIHAYMSNGRLIVDESTGLRDRDIGNDPGEVWWTRRATQDRIKWLPGFSPPAELYTHLGFIERGVDLLTGSFDVTRGVNPTGVTAARAVVALQRAAGIRVRARMREMEDTVTDVGRMMAQRLQEFAPGFMQLADTNGTFHDFVMTEDERLSAFNLKVDVVSNLDDLKALEFQKLMVLFQLGMVDDERLIKNSGMSSSETVLAELPVVREKRAAMAAAQQGSPDVQGAADSVGGVQRSVNKSLRANMGE